MNQFEDEYEYEYNDDNEFESYDDFELEDIVIDDTDDTDDDVEETSEPTKNPGRKPTRSKLIGKHSLAHDSIFKGKKINHEEEYDESEYIIKNAGGSLDINEDLLDFEESRDSVQYYRETRLKAEIKKVLEEFNSKFSEVQSSLNDKFSGGDNVAFGNETDEYKEYETFIIKYLKNENK